MRLRPDFADAWANLGASRANSGDITGAIADFQQAYRHAHSDAARRAYAGALRQLGGEIPE